MIGLGLSLALGNSLGGNVAPAPSAENLLLWTEAFDNAVWTVSGGLTVTANTDTSPTGSATADRCSSPGIGAAITQASATAASAGSAANQNVTLLVTWQRASVTGTFDGTEYTFSVYLCGESGATARLTLDVSGGFLRCAVSDQENGLVFKLWGAQLETGSSATAYVSRTT